MYNVLQQQHNSVKSTVGIDYSTFLITSTTRNTELAPINVLFLYHNYTFMHFQILTYLHYT